MMAPKDAGRLITRLAWLYAAGFFVVVVSGYVPGLTDADGRLLGLFKIDPFDDAVHAVSGAWAAFAAWRSPRAAQWYFRLFGIYYTLDALVGLLTGLSSLSIVTNIAVNVPHLILGPGALAAGFWLGAGKDAPLQTRWRRRHTLVLALPVVVFTLLYPINYVTSDCDIPPVSASTPPAGSAQPTRSEAWTYLTLPEWYIVFSTDEYAAFLADNRPSAFPYLRAAGQYWDLYHEMYCRTADTFPTDYNYHSTLMVIGSSFTAEYALKALYEGTVGRVTEWLSSSGPVAEDVFAQTTAQDYAAFMHTTPWFAYPFGQRIGELWGTTPFFGSSFVRKLERRIALTAEYGFKAGYGRLIGLLNAAAYSPDALAITLTVDNVPAGLLADDQRVQEMAVTGEGRSVLRVPRYAAFTEIVTRLVRDGVTVSDIAGNRFIMLTALSPRSWTYSLPDGEELVRMDILTQPALSRVGVRVPVPALHSVIRGLDRDGVTVEHLYDY